MVLNYFTRLVLPPDNYNFIMTAISSSDELNNRILTSQIVSGIKYSQVNIPKPSLCKRIICFVAWLFISVCTLFLANFCLCVRGLFKRAIFPESGWKIHAKDLKLYEMEKALLLPKSNPSRSKQVLTSLSSDDIGISHMLKLLEGEILDAVATSKMTPLQGRNGVSFPLLGKPFTVVTSPDSMNIEFQRRNFRLKWKHICGNRIARSLFLFLMKHKDHLSLDSQMINKLMSGNGALTSYLSDPNQTDVLEKVQSEIFLYNMSTVSIYGMRCTFTSNSADIMGSKYSSIIPNSVTHSIDNGMENLIVSGVGMKYLFSRGERKDEFYPVDLQRELMAEAHTRKNVWNKSFSNFGAGTFLKLIRSGQIMKGKLHFKVAGVDYIVSASRDRMKLEFSLGEYKEVEIRTEHQIALKELKFNLSQSFSLTYEKILFLRLLEDRDSLQEDSFIRVDQFLSLILGGGDFSSITNWQKHSRNIQQFLFEKESLGSFSCGMQAKGKF